MLAQRAVKFSTAELRLDALGNANRNLILYRKHVADITIIAARPNLRLRAGVDKLNGDSDCAACAAHTALQEIACTKLPRRRHSVAVLLFDERRRVARDNGISSPARQRRTDVLGYPVREVGSVGTLAEVLEREDGDCRLGPKGVKIEIARCRARHLTALRRPSNATSILVAGFVSRAMNR